MSCFKRDHFLRYQAIVSKYASLLRSAESNHYRLKVAECRGKQRLLFTLVDDWLGKPRTTPLPTNPSDLDLAKRFSSFSSNNEENINAVFFWLFRSKKNYLEKQVLDFD